ncbi:MAG: hypothetical protein IKG25_04190 [Mogibacterium sp.]|nr:hypothetical protein [Mogibacterium sp.]
MAGQIAEAYVQIIPTTDGIASGISEGLGDEGAAGGKSFFRGFLGGAAKLLAAAGVGKLFKSALDEGGAIQQSFGGLETIYGEAAEGAKAYARAAASAGISMNDYAEQAVSFGAALKQAYGGDTQQAMEAANTALLDMADNSAKMGTDMSAIQSAYQGFAKQNYTMLDNLKLGYGGTKTEMERLLADAQAITGVEYDIDNLGDVYEAIHVIQGELGLTGVAAEEAKTTFTGSFNAMKVAGKNFLADLALGNDIGPALATLTESVVTFAGNVIPMISNIIGAAPQAIVQLLTGLGPLLLSAGMEAIMSLGQGLAAAIPGLISSIAAMIPQIVSGFSAMIPQLLSVAAQIIQALAQGLIAALPGLIAALPGMISDIANGLTSSIGIIIEAGIQLFMGLVEALPTIAAALIAAAPEIVQALISGLSSMAGTLASAASSLWSAIVSALTAIAGPLVSAAKTGITNAINAVKSAASNALAAAKTVAQSIVSGIQSGISNAANAARNIGTAIINAIKSFVGQLVSAGRNLIVGLAEGIAGSVGAAIAAAKAAVAKVVAAAKSALGIASPSKVFMGIGENVTLGLAEGIVEDTKPVTDAIDSVANKATTGMESALSVNAALGVSSDTEATGDLRTLIAVVNALSRKIDNIGVYLDGDRMVGQLVERMDDALGNRAVLTGRGQA